MSEVQGFFSILNSIKKSFNIPIPVPYIKLYLVKHYRISLYCINLLFEVITYLLFLQNLGKYFFGQNKEYAAINTHNMANSSNSWPIRLRVAWKYIELRPTIISRAQSTWMPWVTKRPYSLNRYINTGGSNKNRKLLIYEKKRKRTQRIITMMIKPLNVQSLKIFK